MALSSQQLTPLTFCYVLSKFDELPYLKKLIEKQYFSILLNDEEILEVYALLRDNKRIIVVGDFDADGKADLVGYFTGAGCWLRYTADGSWEKLADEAVTLAISAGKMR